MKTGKDKKKFYLTTPLYYVNAAPHIGHSYTQIAADTLARFRRLMGDNVFFMTGTDEHGEKIEKATLEAGYKTGDEQKFVDKIVPGFVRLWKDLDITYDRFIRTTDEYHRAAVRDILSRLFKKGDIYKDIYDGMFCTPCETFWSYLQAPEGVCPDCKRPLEKQKEENYFFRISAHRDWLIKYIKDNPRFIMPDYRRNEVLSFLEAGPLNDLCISRSKRRLKWGIELPFDKDYVTYVWFDALINYVSGAGFIDNKERFGRLWPVDIHIIGKDIIRHHAVYWPIMLRAAGIELPKSIFAHGWWTTKGEKMSKSKGNIVDPYYIVEKYGVDPYRYFLLRDVPFGLDGSFSEKSLVGRFNADLANDLGNLLNRTLSMMEKYFAGTVPQVSRSGPDIKKDALELSEKLEISMEALNFSGALTAVWEFINKANKSIEVAAPWKLAKEKKTAELAAFIYGLIESLRIIAISIYPFMPRTAGNMWGQLGLEGIDKVSFGDIGEFGVISPGMKIKKGPPMFPRIEQ